MTTVSKLVDDLRGGLESMEDEMEKYRNSDRSRGFLLSAEAKFAMSCSHDNIRALLDERDEFIKALELARDLLLRKVVYRNAKSSTDNALEVINETLKAAKGEDQ